MKIFISLKVKIICLIAGIMVITAATIITISNIEIGNAMLAQQNKFSRHVLYLIDLNIKGSYNNLVFKKLNSVLRNKNMLKSRTEFIMKMVKQQVQHIQAMGVSLEDAKRIIIQWVENASSKKMGQLFLTDKNLRIFAHPDPSALGADISGFTDMKNQTVAQIIDSAPSGRPMLNVFNWIDSSNKHAKHLTCFRKLEEWNWVIGSIINIGDIEVEALKAQSKIVDILNKTFKKITIAKTGFAFLFDRNGKVLAITDDKLADKFEAAVNSTTGNTLYQDMIKTADKSDGSLYYNSELVENKEMIAYVNFFKPLGWYVGVTVPVAEIKLPAKKIISKQSTYIGIVLLCSILITAWIVSRISRPLNLLSEHAKKFSNLDFTSDDQDDSSIEALGLKHNDEVGRLADSFLFMKTQLRKNIKQLIQTTAQNERIEGELNTAKEIQLGILPKIFPPFPDCRQIDIYASLKPAKEVGGDLYDYYFIDNNKLCFTIGDVSDKGVPAALMMVITKTLIKNSASKNITPAGIMMEVNNAINSDNPRSMFVTLIVGVLDLSTGLVTYSNGGHNPPVLINKQNSPEYLKNISGPVVGAMEDMAYKDLTVELKPGEALFMYTDGVTEAMDSKKTFYSEQRLADTIKTIGLQGSEPVIKGVTSDIKEFVGQASQYDDIAMLMIKYNGDR